MPRLKLSLVSLTDETARWRRVHFLKTRQVFLKTLGREAEIGCGCHGRVSGTRSRGPALITVNGFIKPDGAPLCSKSLHYTCITGWLSENASPSIITPGYTVCFVSQSLFISFSLSRTHLDAQFPDLRIMSDDFYWGEISFASDTAMQGKRFQEMVKVSPVSLCKE